MSSGAPRRAELAAIFREALAAVDGGAAVRRCVAGDGARVAIAGRALPDCARLRVLAVGKAADAMARAFEAQVGPRLAEGLVVTKRGQRAALARCERIEAAHPVPDASSEAAARRVLGFVAAGRQGDELCVLLSGGASSLLACGVDGVGLLDVAGTTRLLLEAGADIEALNAVRKHLCAAAGGRLAALARGARVSVLALSDVPGDRIDLIGSGPFAPDASRFADALAALAAHRLLDRVPAAVRAHLEAGLRGAAEETPGPGASCFAAVETFLLASNRTAVEAVRDAALRRGLAPRVLSPPLRGEARAAAALLVELGRRARGERPLLLVAGGETTVHVTGDGRGGRNQELALAAAIELEGGDAALLLAAGTDGDDGPTDAAGAFADEQSVARGRLAGVDAREALRRNDSHGFFCAEGGVFRTGPTGTNVMDLALLRVEPGGRAEAAGRE